MMGIYKNKPLGRDCNEEQKKAAHILFECAALSQGRVPCKAHWNQYFRKNCRLGF